MIKQWLFALVAWLALSSAHAFMPQTGSWGISSELNGKPGRGIALDAQNGTLVVTIYAYESNGQPVFYGAAGSLVNDQFSAPLIRYQGGRFFGSGARTATESASPGMVRLRFTSGVSGFVQFPGEAELAIERFSFGYQPVPASLKGIWSFTGVGDTVWGGAVKLSEQIDASTNGNGIVMSADGMLGCEHIVRGSLAGSVICVELTSSGQLVRAYNFKYSVNEGEGVVIDDAGNSQGLVFVRRITTPSGVGTGIVFKSQSTAAVQALGTILRHNIAALTTRIVPR